MGPGDGGYLHGLIVDAQARCGVFFGYLVYIFVGVADSPLPVPSLDLDGLLVPPMIVDGTGWNMGYFQRVERRGSDYPRLRQHCFESKRRASSLYFDERSNQVEAPCHPLGTFGIFSIRGVDGEVASALVGGSPPHARPI